MIFQGVATALVTPFNGEYVVDEEALRYLIRRQIAYGIDAVVLCGTTGEAPTLTEAERAFVFKIGHEECEGKLPLICGCGTNDTAAAIRLCKAAMENGADGFLINNPYYNKSSDEGIFAHYAAINEAVDRPIIAYNVPSRTGKNMSAKLMRDLTKLEHLAGFKEASGDISQLSELCAEKGEGVSVYSGCDDIILPVLYLGGDGVICTCSNLTPALCLNITDAFFEGNLEGARRAQFALLDLYKALFCECNPIPLKYAMNSVGLPAGKLRLPLVELTGQKANYVKSTLAEYGGLY